MQLTVLLLVIFPLTGIEIKHNQLTGTETVLHKRERTGIEIMWYKIE